MINPPRPPVVFPQLSLVLRTASHPACGLRVHCGGSEPRRPPSRASEAWQPRGVCGSHQTPRTTGGWFRKPPRGWWHPPGTHMWFLGSPWYLPLPLVFRTGRSPTVGVQSVGDTRASVGGWPATRGSRNTRKSPGHGSTRTWPPACIPSTLLGVFRCLSRFGRVEVPSGGLKASETPPRSRGGLNHQ